MYYVINLQWFTGVNVGFYLFGCAIAKVHFGCLGKCFDMFTVFDCNTRKHNIPFAIQSKKKFTHNFQLNLFVVLFIKFSKLTHFCKVSNASCGLVGFPYILDSKVTIVSAPITMSTFGLSSASAAAFKRFVTSSTFCSAVSSTNSEKPAKSLILRSSSNVDAQLSTFKP